MVKSEISRMREKVEKAYAGKDVVVLDSENTPDGFMVREKGHESTFAPTVSVEVFEKEGEETVSLHFLDCFTWKHTVSECIILDNVDEYTARSMLEMAVACRFGVMPDRSC